LALQLNRSLDLILLCITWKTTLYRPKQCVCEELALSLKQTEIWLIDSIAIIIRYERNWNFHSLCVSIIEHL